jgi:hypothetical protein
MKTVCKPHGLFWGAVILLLAGCTADEPGPSALEAPSVAAVPSASSTQLKARSDRTPTSGPWAGRHVRREEAAFFSLESDVPGFGGYWFDENGDMVVQLKDATPGRSAVARTRLTGVLNGRRNGLANRGGDIRISPADYTFSELAAWRDVLTDDLVGKGVGVRSTDADEVRNRVVVGISNPSVRSVVRRAASALGVPQNALVIVEEGPVTPDLGVVGAVPRAVFSGDVYGGMPLLRTGGGLCTIGFFATHNGAMVGVSNSHCSSDTHGGPDGSEFKTIAQQVIGYEVADRGFYDWCPDLFGILQWCRYADAMLFSTVGPAAVKTNQIVRFNVTNPGSSGGATYTAINPTNPFHVVNGRSSTSSGETVYKAGATTGRTQGTITATCKDIEYVILPIGPVMGCQHEATYGRAGGDSGAPVFTWPYGPANVDLRGIHWGKYPQFTGLKTVFSPLSGIERDFGALSGIATGPVGGGGSGGAPCVDPVTGLPILC